VEGAHSYAALEADADAWAVRSLDVLLSMAGVRRAGLALVEGGGRRLKFTSADHTARGPVEWCHVDAYDDVPLNTAVRSGQAVVGTLAQLGRSHPEFASRQDESQTVAVAAVPLMTAGRMFGGFVVFYDTHPAFDDDATRELHELAGRLVHALTGARARDARPPTWTLATPSGALVEQFEVDGDPAAVGPARSELRSILLGWGTDLGTTEAAILCLSELVTNAVVHAGSASSVHVENDGGVITIAVRNTGLLPRPGPGSGEPLAVHGRGLQLVEGLTSRWGAEQDGTGVTTWFVLET
jgi:anti-sigma regulatory factor (Ser/Thr protein kinase)